MKNLLIIALVLSSTSLFAQSKWNFRVGVLTPIPVNVENNYRIDMGSGLAGLSYAASKKVDVTLTSGFLRFQGFGSNEDFTNVPVLAGARYHVDKHIYFGVSAGPVFFNKTFEQTDAMMYVPHVGYQTGHLSIDANYFNWYDLNNGYNNMALCVSYTL